MYKIYNVAIFCWVVALAVFAGNTFYQVNNWAGGMDSIYSMPPDFNYTVAIQVSSCVGYAVVVSGLLIAGQTYYISIGLGIILVAMVSLFLVVVIELGIDWERFALGLIPNFPSGSANIMLSLVGTTSIGFNLFLGSSLAEDAKSLAGAQRGISFSVVGAFLISILIMIVGDGVDWDKSESFSIQLMADLVKDTVGEVGLWFFSLGFMAAAVSSMITVCLGAALCADSIFSTEKPKETMASRVEIVKMDDLTLDHTPSKSHSLESLGKHSEDDFDQQMPRWIYYGMMLVIVAVATIVNSFHVDTALVIQIAQVFNGCLLPLFSFCLLLCINDNQFMYKRPQLWWANVLLVLAVTITLMLAVNSIIVNIFSSLLGDDDNLPLYIAAGLAPVIMAVAMGVSGVWRDIWHSFKRGGCCNSNNSTQ